MKYIYTHILILINMDINWTIFFILLVIFIDNEYHTSDRRRPIHSIWHYGMF